MHSLTIALVAAAAQQPAPQYTHTELDLGGSPLRVAVGAFNADASEDLVVLSRRNSTTLNLVTVGLVGSKAKSNRLSGLIQSGYLNAPNMVAGDLNGDELTDVGLSTVVIPQQSFLGQGHLSLAGLGSFPTFGGAQYALGFTDVDGDGWRDSVLLVNDFGGGFLDFGLNDGTGVMRSGSFDFAPGPADASSRLLFADVLGQGADSTFVSSSSGLFRSAWPAGPSSNELLLAGDLAEAVAADFDAVGGADLAVCDRGADGVRLLLNDGLGNFPAASFQATGSLPESLVAADLDGDGDVDLAVANRRGHDVAILLNDGSGSLVLGARWPVGERPVDITAGDLNGDGRVDLAVACDESGSVSLLLSH